MNTNYLKTFESFVFGKVEISMPLWQVGKVRQLFLSVYDFIKSTDM